MGITSEEVRGRREWCKDRVVPIKMSAAELG